MAETEIKEAKKVDDLRVTLIKEAAALGLKLPRLSFAGVKDKKPENLAKEKARQDKQFIHLLQTAIAKHKEVAKMKPIEKKRALLIARFKAVKSQTRANTYSDANIKAWLEELDLIDRNPKSWNKITVNGTKPYIPSNKRKKTSKEILDGMDLE